jgi:dTDP-4-amino-4,6-dideoxygalactose transaminase
MKIEWDKPDIGPEEIAAAVESLTHGIGAKGKNISELELEFQEKIGCKQAILVNNGTSALIAANIAMKNKYPNISTIGIPSFTFIASLFSSRMVFQDYKLLDCSPSNWNLDPKGLTKEVELTLLVDVGGIPCDYQEFISRGGVYIADSAESLGSRYKGEIVGSQLPIHTFSFQRSKIITCGEGGLLAVNDEELAEDIRAIVNHGYARDKKDYEYIHNQFGLNFRMCDVEAAILKVQLGKLDFYLKRRNEIAAYYRMNLNKDFKFQEVPDYAVSNYFFFGILVDKGRRDKLASYLGKQGISVKCWKAIHHQENIPYFDLPNADLISDCNILLPIHNSLSDEEVEYIVYACNNF